MKFEKLLTHFEKFCFKSTIGKHRGKILYDFILDFKPKQCLELGTGQGTSSCYIAAALDEIGKGQLITVDLFDQPWQDPSIEVLLSETGLQNYVNVVRESTYTWFLKKKIDENTINNFCSPIYDFCFIDGSKYWETDGLAFFLVDKLLNTEGWILFDDLKWTFREVHGKWNWDYINRMRDDELDTPHIESIFRLLVMQHENYCDFRIQDDWWAWAHKTHASTKKCVIMESRTLKAILRKFLRELIEVAGRIIK